MTSPLLRGVILVECALLLALFGARAGAAQSARTDTHSRQEIIYGYRVPGTMHRITASPVSADSARNACLMFGSARKSPDVFQAGNCRPRGCSVAGSTTRNGWTACEYEHDWISQAATSQPADTLREIEVVLYRTPITQPRSARDRPAAQQFTPVWQETYEPEYFRSVTPSVTSVDVGVLLLAIQECVNGTGGCEQSFLLDRGRGWRPVKLAFLDSVEQRYPGAAQRTFRVNPRTLTAEVFLYANTDANCCPSRSAVVTLRLRGDALEAKTIRKGDLP